jgi:tetratricopeptide (TPR) repeat protein
MWEQIELDPQIAEDYSDLGLTSDEKGHKYLTKVALDRVIECMPDCTTAYQDRSSYYLQSGEWNKAIDDLSKAIELDPYLETHSKRGAAYIAAKEYDLAIADLDIAIKFHSDDNFALNSRGVAHAKKGNYSLAVNDFSKSSFITKMKYRGGLHNFVVANLAQASLEMGHYVMAYNTSLEVARDAKDPDLITKAKQNIRRVTGKDKPSKTDELLLGLLTMKHFITSWFSEGKSLTDIEIELKQHVGIIRSLMDKTEWVTVFNKERVKLIPMPPASLQDMMTAKAKRHKKSLAQVMRMARKRQLEVVLHENKNTESSLPFDASGLLTEASIVKMLSKWTLGYIKEKPYKITS